MKTHNLLILLICSFFITLIDASMIPDKNEFLKALQGPHPTWMDEQIQKDLQTYQSGITSDMLNNLLTTYDSPDFCLVRFTVTKGQLSCRGGNNLPDRLNIYRQAIQFLIDTVGLPNLDFVMTLHDMCLTIPKEFPIVGYGKERFSYGILIPDFVALTNYKVYGIDIKSPIWSQHSWESKNMKAFWRGASTGGYFTKGNWDTFPRTELALISLKHPEFVDAKITNVVQADPDVAQILLQNNLLGNRVAIKDHLTYRYLIDVDGNGWTVPRCFWILLSNSLLLKQDSDSILWYSAGVKPYEHYVPISRKASDIFEKIEWAKNNDLLAQQIALQATNFAQKDLSHVNTYVYLYKVLTEYAKLQR